MARAFDNLSQNPVLNSSGDGSPFAGMGPDLLREGSRLAASPPRADVRMSIAPGESQLAQAGQPQGIPVRATELIPSRFIDLQRTLDARGQLRLDMGLLSESESRGIDPNIIRPASMQELSTGLHGIRDLLAPGQRPTDLQMSIEPILEYAQRIHRDNPSRMAREVGVQIALMGRSVNQLFEQNNSPIRFGPLEVAVDAQGHTFYGLPVLHDGTRTSMLRFPTLMSPSEIEYQRANRPRNV